MNIAFSPCPNDTFVFHAWVHRLLEGAPELNVTYADIDKTNSWAARREGPEVMKISYAALPYVIDDYELIPCGGALGRGCGPLVLSKNGGADPSTLAGKTVAVPSDKSTAYLLFRLWAAQKIPEGPGKITVMPFHEIMPAVRDGKIDAGLVIHEARFTYKDYNLDKVADLGDWWEEDTGFPIPLGAIIARRSLGMKAPLTEWIRESVEFAWANPDASMDYVMEHAQEMSQEVARSHIDLYVNEFTRELGEDGYAAVESLLGRAADEGLIPAFDLQKLRD
ncbi:1,4-dihydroxy-6-naphthoate synthase [Salipaludibacillus aurantiacus]|uniref:1,4-dihydroxy-6-naphtoate synthase n=1 Tax=Salipaludibacillus aurantiacus TaxID=1601833 RepID=A0A1H9X6K7_9BACI|nr:1,4-dihydroxy-6-naphthoate synthase [Salipaludibacillus aurantiacus]SES41507.1 1,4-dihydroxy-6-naphthoate synthase [Salipaludibacillus aurantiacus]